jgi:hypothetical protein
MQLYFNPDQAEAIFAKQRNNESRKIRASREILVYLLIGRFTKQTQFLPDFKRSGFAKASPLAGRRRG